jgi:hypothetical protein
MQKYGTLGQALLGEKVRELDKKERLIITKNSGLRVRPEPDYTAGNQNGTRFPFRLIGTGMTFKNSGSS